LWAGEPAIEVEAVAGNYSLMLYVVPEVEHIYLAEKLMLILRCQMYLCWTKESVEHKASL
jgi:hypothetical protein